ncbi:Precorrin-6A reductase [Roseovarius albus]|uniref:Precorrin-6A reductase n=1 Tax=Roseovarius albus TaxID=1247867 RepID=A0A1X6ZD00_9RHOB|nr:cobalt-precorrin-6A reductase [Roseovarius albus]SLN47824.1 Precorrin-6A reductase [Roseovarius albus]
MTLLLLAGTSQAQKIAAELAAQGCDAIASLAGVTRSPKAIGIPTRVGGFGGSEEFRNYLTDNEITAVLDATHPFAADISSRSCSICRDEGVPYCQLLRPGWEPIDGDRWTLIDREEDAVQHIAPGSTVFLATGRQTLERFENLSSCRLICRQIDPPEGPFPFGNGEFLIGRPPFSVEEEVCLFKELGVDWLTVKNAGGQASYSKLEAARQLNIRVAMIRRPPLLEGATIVETVEAALDWVGRQ